MATQREWESVVWHFLGDKLKATPPNEIKNWIWGYEPSTDAQEQRWLKAIERVQEQVEKFAGEEGACDEECVGLKRV